MTALPVVRRIRPCCDALFLHGTQPRFGSQKASVVWFYLRGCGATHRDGVCAEKEGDHLKPAVPAWTSSPLIVSSRPRRLRLASWAGAVSGSWPARRAVPTHDHVRLAGLDQPSAQRAARSGTSAAVWRRSTAIDGDGPGIAGGMESLVESGTRPPRDTIRTVPRQTLENHKKRIVSRRRFQTLRLIGEQVAESLSGNFLP